MHNEWATLMGFMKNECNIYSDTSKQLNKIYRDTCKHFMNKVSFTLTGIKDLPFHSTDRLVSYTVGLILFGILSC